MERSVESLQERGPPAPSDRPWSRSNAPFELVERELDPSHRPVCPHHRQSDDRLPSPAGEVVDVQRKSRRQEDELRRKCRYFRPGVEPEEREPDVCEHAHRVEPAGFPNERRRAAHVLGVGRIARQAKGDIRLDGGREVGSPSLEIGPATVVMLLGADPVRAQPGSPGLPDSEELPQEHVLGIHRDVRLKLALPPSLGALEREEVVASTPHRLLRGGGKHLPRRDLFLGQGDSTGAALLVSLDRCLGTAAHLGRKD